MPLLVVFWGYNTRFVVGLIGMVSLEFFQHTPPSYFVLN